MPLHSSQAPNPKPDIIDQAYIGPENILELVDEYTLYRHYTGIENLTTRTGYRSPIREDDNHSSFSFWEINGSGVEFLWKDSGRGWSGDIFKLIKMMKGFTYQHQVYKDIDHEFDLGLFSDSQPTKSKIFYPKLTRPPLDIRIKSMPFIQKNWDYWNQFGIENRQIDKFYVTKPEFIWWSNDQEAPSYVIDTHCYAYRIGDKYQLYWPYKDKDDKFRNNLPSDYFLGYLQLPPTGKKLVIDKSLKDVMFCDTIDYCAVAGKSETTMIPHHKMLELLDRFDEVFLTLDPDEAGRIQTEKYLSLYPSLKPRFLTEAKDKTDLCLVKGVKEARRIVKQILQ